MASNTTATTENSSEASSSHNMEHDKDALIQSLRNQKAAQNEMIEGLQRELGEAEIRHKEEVYWLRLELDNLGREKESIEDRVAEMYRDLSGFDAATNPDQAVAEAAEHANMSLSELRETLSKYSRTVAILENQTSMVKQSCDEVVKSLKLEISDVMEDKTRMEMDLLNQLAVLDNDKREIEMDFEEQLKYKNEKIKELQESGAGTTSNNNNNNSGASSSRSKKSSSGSSNKDVEELMKELSELKTSKRTLEEDLVQERNDLEDEIMRLQETNADLEQQMESMASDLDVMRQGAAAEAIQVLDALTRDRQETLTTLERVAMIWEKADDSVQGLEDVMDELRPSEDDHVQGDRERLLSTLETASLVHGQIKVSLLLVELKLRNQLASLKNDKLRLGSSNGSSSSSVTASGGVGGSGTLNDANLTERMKEIQQEALTALTQVEDSLTDQIKQLENLTREETTQVRDDLQDKTDELRTLQAQQKKLEVEVSRLRKQEEQYKKEKKELLYGSKKQEEAAAAAAETAISKQVLERLQNEVLTVVERVREKNDTIGRLQTTIEEHKLRETALKRELKRMMKASRNSAVGGAGGAGAGVSASRRV